ncbi:hypothetical protein [Pyxidicoccus fallax]|uniref:hypothetical protein n=1 Tax=Pyxidicoccus fallax TaxID=394095 RepID=UPI0035308172
MIAEATRESLAPTVESSAGRRLKPSGSLHKIGDNLIDSLVNGGKLHLALTAPSLLGDVNVNLNLRLLQKCREEHLSNVVRQIINDVTVRGAETLIHQPLENKFGTQITERNGHAIMVRHNQAALAVIKLRT